MVSMTSSNEFLEKFWFDDGTVMPRVGLGNHSYTAVSLNRKPAAGKPLFQAQVMPPLRCLTAVGVASTYYSKLWSAKLGTHMCSTDRSGVRR
jgi:hypothetical protein